MRTATYVEHDARIGIRRPTSADCESFTALAEQSRTFHHPWAEPPTTREQFETYLRSRNGTSDDGFLVCDLATGGIAGVININCIIRGSFQSAFLGYYAFENFARRGFMTAGMNLLIRHAFTQMKLHRLEANIQPANVASIALAQRCGLRKEGFSPRYLKVLGEWRDHERWAIVAKDAP